MCSLMRWRIFSASVVERVFDGEVGDMVGGKRQCGGVGLLYDN